MQSNHRDDRRTIRVGDDAMMFKSILGIDFGNDQRDVGNHSERGRIVDEGRPRIHDERGEVLRHRIGNRPEDDIHPLERCFLGFFDLDFFSVKRDVHADTACAGQQTQAGDGKIPFFQNLDHFPADHPGRP